MSVLELVSVRKSYSTDGVVRNVLDDVSFTLQAGELAWISGPSGGGKTTLLNILGLLSAPDSGQYRLDGRELSHLSHRDQTSLRATVVSTIFQRGNLFGHLTALENVRLALPRDNVRRARLALRSTNLDGLDDRRASTLSGGEQQRVSIARAMARGSRVILADEPTSSLDDQNAQTVLEMLQSAARAGSFVVIASHDSRVAAAEGRRLRLTGGKVT
jgi:ABC-type lipoprotein export system ATPase subunit